MNIKVATLIAAAVMAVSAADAQVSLDSCRHMALANNNNIKISAEKIRAAGYKKQEAFAAYLPAIDFAGGYLRNQKDISLLGSDQLLPTKSFNPATGTYDFNLVIGPDGKPVMTPDGQYIPSTVAYIPKDALTFDIKNVFFGAVTLTQPVYMGGKIVALNKIASYNTELQQALRDNDADNVVTAVDAAYWQVVSLKAKQRLATSYVALLDTLHSNVNSMVKEGVATKSDLLAVAVKLNQAQVDLTKVENGLSLSRMALAQLCGQPIDQPMILADEDRETLSIKDSDDYSTIYSMEDVYANRDDVKALELAVKIYEQKEKVVLSEMLPNVALMGAYSFSNPNMFNGFEKKFNGMFSVGAVVKIPIWHWGGDYAKVKSAKSDLAIRRLELDDAKDKIRLQTSQASFKMEEAKRSFRTATVNLDNANENLRQAQLGFKEGVLTPEKVMEAQTAWLKANSEQIDSEIDLHLCQIYLAKALGRLKY